MNRAFVVQEHTVAPGDVHWDLMVEGDAEGGPLVTVQLAAPPTGAVSGRRIADHRRLYLEYEGPVSNERGTVAIWDRGQVEDVEAEPRAARWRGRFLGRRLHGAWALEERDDTVSFQPGADA